MESLIRLTPKGWCGCSSALPNYTLNKEMTDSIETTPDLTPRWNADGLITAVVTDASTGEPLMLAHMNEESLRLTIESGEAWFWSRSRARLWKKGESSGHVLKVVELRIDCDQDALWVRAEPQGPACHTGARSCFYRRVQGDRLIREP
jgi:phosphoribosyl-AMP cyclohydrolase